MAGIIMATRTDTTDTPMGTDIIGIDDEDDDSPRKRGELFVTGAAFEAGCGGRGKD